MHEIEQLEKSIGYVFNDKKLLDLAITHSSFGTNPNDPCNERLEFLGDAVLELSVSDFLYKNYKMSEGELSRFRANIVCETSLAKVARKYDIGKFLKIGHGEETSGGRKKNSILADATEALFGAMFLDSGFEQTKNKIIEMLKSTEDIIDQKNAIDPKSKLQELLQRDSTIPVVYKIISEKGPAHNKSYVSEVLHNGKILGRGSGKSKKDSEQQAALQAINNFFSH